MGDCDGGIEGSEGVGKGCVYREWVGKMVIEVMETDVMVITGKWSGSHLLKRVGPRRPGSCSEHQHAFIAFERFPTLFSAM